MEVGWRSFVVFLVVRGVRRLYGVLWSVWVRRRRRGIRKRRWSGVIVRVRSGRVSGGGVLDRSMVEVEVLGVGLVLLVMGGSRGSC